MIRMEIGRLGVQCGAAGAVASPFLAVADCAVLGVQLTAGSNGFLGRRHRIRDGHRFFRNAMFVSLVVIALRVIGVTVPVTLHVTPVHKSPVHVIGVGMFFRRMIVAFLMGDCDVTVRVHSHEIRITGHLGHLRR
jgi:hypothetical protein